ncbi:MAG: permease-like cell division protein FtsX [Bacteroidaceae bacterium]|nr:permease-like cell division protein FtsX [Bacteroidaceae bacterium]
MKTNSQKETAPSRKGRARSGFNLQWLTSCVSTTLVLVLLGLVVLCGLSASRMSDVVRENMTVTLLLNENLDSTDTELLEAQFRQHPAVRETKLVTGEQILTEEIARLGDDPSVFLNGENPYGSTLELHVNAVYANSDSLLKYSAEWKQLWQIDDVVYQPDIVANVNHTLHRIMAVLVVLAALLTIISVVLVHNTVRLSVYARRWTIHTMRLVGASWSFICRPFLLRSLGIALVSSVLASAMLIGGVMWMSHHDGMVLQIVTTDIQLIVVAAVVVAALLLTQLSTWLTVMHFLRMRETEMYK